MEENRKEHLALVVGFVLILIVLIITLFRWDSQSNKSSSAKQGSLSSTKSNENPTFATISPSSLQEKILINNKAGMTLLDIRSFEAFSNEHIVDSIGISLDEFPVGQKIDARNQIIVIGQNSSDEDIAKAVEKIKEEKFKNILVLAGGMDTWKQMLGLTVHYGDPKSFIDQSKVSYLDPQELHDAIESKAPLYIIDVRSKDDFSTGHIAGAINIPFDELEKRRGEVTERKAVIVGINELQEFQASVQLYDMLLISPYVMRTAMPGWQSKGFELVK